MSWILWILAAYWLIGSVAKGVNRYRDDLDYSRNRASAALHAVGWALIWPAVEVIEAVRETRA